MGSDAIAPTARRRQFGTKVRRGFAGSLLDDFSWSRSVAQAVAICLHLGLFVVLSASGSSSPDVPIVDDNEEYSELGSELLAQISLDRGVASVSELGGSVSAPALKGDPTTVRSRSPAAEGHIANPASVLAGDPSIDDPKPLRLFGSDGRPLLPEDSFSGLSTDSFSSYRVPGGDNEDSVFYRPVALDPRTTQFAKAWIERGNLLDDSVNRLVEKGTATLSVKINQKFSLVCKVAVVGVAGTCVVERVSGNEVVIQRPPEAPWEHANTVQCRELRDALETAETAEAAAMIVERLSSLCSRSQ